jgi:hypothetical protein
MIKLRVEFTHSKRDPPWLEPDACLPTYSVYPRCKSDESRHASSTDYCLHQGDALQAGHPLGTCPGMAARV